MQDLKREFIEFLVSRGVLRFGDFVTKSGRRTPYFVDTGRYRSGEDIDRLARFYARTIVDHPGLEFDALFGPAYKGIPLAVATALVLWRDHGRRVGFCFDRKEAKDHGEGGRLVGHELADGERVLLIEDVTTAGTSIRETVPLLRTRARVELAGLVVSVDRMERGKGDTSALEELAAEFHMPALSIVDLDDIVAFLEETGVVAGVRVDAALLDRIRAYRAQYGPRSRGPASGSLPGGR